MEFGCYDDSYEVEEKKERLGDKVAIAFVGVAISIGVIYAYTDDISNITEKYPEVTNKLFYFYDKIGIFRIP